MIKQLLISSAMFGVLIVFPFNLKAQTRIVHTKEAISQMDVLARSRIFEPAIIEAAQSEGIDPLILWAIAYNETRFRPWLTSPKNAKGLMQFMPATASRFGLWDPYEPKASILAAAKYVKVLGRLFEWRLDSILAAYNSGEGTVTAYLIGKSLLVNGKLINPSRIRTNGGVPPYKETRNYVTSGLKIYAWLTKQNRLVLPQNTLASTTTIRRQPAVEINNNQSKQKNEDARPKDLPIVVYYEPRTGLRRVLNNPDTDSLPSGQNGPVIVSPETRIMSGRIARTTFVGRLR
ncbi:MAG: lytic transglycosylase domain-containing protein [Chloracidobacterium sp.]|nr:lytic transglycosylase domain-containing protein [Chloracidobacterium sp.]